MPVRRCGPLRFLGRTCSATATTSINEVNQSTKFRTGILIFDTGNPTNIDEIESYYLRKSLDEKSLFYPLKKYLGPIFVKKKISRFMAEFQKSIDSNYGILKCIQGQKLANALDKLSPETAPHISFIGFQHTRPYIEEAMNRMEIYGIERGVAVSMLPHYSCSVTGHILNRISKYNEEKREPSKILWSTIDRWSSHPAFINSFAKCIKEGLDKFSKDLLGEILIVFSALPHPLKNIYEGDPYHHEVAASVQHIMETIGYCSPYVIGWHSVIGPYSWLGPDTKSVIKTLESSQYKGALLVPISHASEGVLTDMEYLTSLPKHVHKELFKAESPSTRKKFVMDLAELISSHLKSGSPCSKNLYTKCIHCSNDHCIKMRRYFKTAEETIALSRERPLIGCADEYFFVLLLSIQLSSPFAENSTLFQQDGHATNGNSELETKSYLSKQGTMLCS